MAPSPPPPPPPPATTTTTATSHSTLRPWLDDFLSTSSLSLPTSFAQLYHRLHKNLTAFRPNYLILSFIIFLLTLILHPTTFLSFLLIILAWIYLVFSRDEHEPLVVFDFELGRRMLVVIMSIVTFVALGFANVPRFNIFLSVLISAVVVFLHAILRTPDDSDDMESPYGALLSVVDEDGPGRGPYTLV